MVVLWTAISSKLNAIEIILNTNDDNSEKLILKLLALQKWIPKPRMEGGGNVVY